ncbi:MAG: hypothetical protein KBE23_01265 [Chloroflexi bacterium]|nr:hypothetical protein [Chloroflexota bacterium]MBP7041343.1 hypothetical protein [Chloroflexota bacterium]
MIVLIITHLGLFGSPSLLSCGVWSEFCTLRRQIEAKLGNGRQFVSVKNCNQNDKGAYWPGKSAFQREGEGCHNAYGMISSSFTGLNFLPTIRQGVTRVSTNAGNGNTGTHDLKNFRLNSIIQERICCPKLKTTRNRKPPHPNLKLAFILLPN